MEFQPYLPLMYMAGISAFALLLIILILIKCKRISRGVIATDASVFDWFRRVLIIGVAITILWGPSFQVGDALEPRLENNVLFVVDRTGSVHAKDYGKKNATRLSGIKEDIKKIADKYVNSEFSLITFDSTANTQIPFTFDRQAVDEFIDALTPQITKYSTGSKLDICVNEVVDQLKKVKLANPNAENYVYIFSDGENNVNNTSDAPDMSAFSKIKPYILGGGVIGYGSEKGVKIKPYNVSSNTGQIGENQNVIIDEYIKDPSSGEDAISKINPQVLTSIAGELGVNYLYSDGKADISEQIAASTKTDSFTLSRNSLPLVRPVIWPFEYFLAVLMLWEFYHFARMRITMDEEK